MLKNYLIVALRNLAKYKGHTLINVFGLAVGMTCCLLILFYVLTELATTDIMKTRSVYTASHH